MPIASCRVIICSSLIVVGTAAVAVAEPGGRGLALTPAGLPSSLIGEAAVVALAFALPALLAGLYLAVQRLLRGLGLRGALVLGSVGITAAFALAVLEQRPDLLDPGAVLRLAGR